MTSNLKKLNERFRVCEEQTRTCATARRPECQQARAPRNPPLHRLFPGRGRHVPAPSQGPSGLSFCGVLPPSLLFSFIFPCWFLESCLEAGSARWPLRASEGLAGVVAPHLLVAVRFLPTREGSGTKSTGRRPKYRASLHLFPCIWYAAGTFLAVFTDVLGLWFLASSCRNIGNTRS